MTFTCMSAGRWGVSTRDVEVVLHVALSHMYSNEDYDPPPGMNKDACYKALGASADALWRLDPGNPCGALYTTMLPPGTAHRKKVPLVCPGSAVMRH